MFLLTSLDLLDEKQQQVSKGLRDTIQVDKGRLQ